MSGAFTVLRIPVDGHFHGSSDVPKPWVAQITGIDRKYGLARAFVDQLRDYSDARRSCAGRLNGVVACFPLRDGNLYEVSRLRGRSSKRYVAREFLAIADGEMIEVAPVDALARVEPHAGATIEYAVTDGTVVSRVDGLGTPAVCGFVLVGQGRDERLYRLHVGAIHEVDTGTDRYLILVDDVRARRISQAEALAHMTKTLEAA